MNTLFPTEYQMFLFHEGTFFQSHQLFGAHIFKISEKIVTRFCLWAPNANEVRLIGDFNGWNGVGHKLERVNGNGVWVLAVDQDLEGHIYKYEIITQSGEILHKSDPYGFYSEVRPNTASVVYSLKNFEWNDQKWLQKKEKRNSLSGPMAIYEVHVGSWKTKIEDNEERFLTYRELADELIPYVLEQGFTHIELLPLVEHPLDASWGYQGTGYFSATSRYGTPHDLMYFIDLCHQNGIGVILDWVPGHFCKDAHGLYRFDGSHSYSYENVSERENHVWGTANFDLGKGEVQSFLISNALFWMEHFHIDGFRVDAVANIIYWPNRESTEENLLGVDFLKKLNNVIHEYDPNFLIMAEDSTDWANVTVPVTYGGLGFTYKWNMGWMNDVLDYMETFPNNRKYHHSKMTFSLVYAFTENFALPFSHDEVVHGKKSLLNKMPGDYNQKFAQLRLLLGYMIAHPGKKLLFMGSEFGQFSEWNDKSQLDWNLFDYDMHLKLNAYVKELLKFYKTAKPLYEQDHIHEGFDWIDVHNTEQSVFSFIRQGKKPEDFLVVVGNFTEQSYQNYRVGVPWNCNYREIINSDKEEHGGTGAINKRVITSIDEPFHGKPFSVELNIPPFGIVILRPVKQRKERIGNGKEKVRSNVVGRRERK